MKSKASLVLMEQLMMILVFALAASMCLQVFLYADGISRETALRDQAVLLAQNGAETLKSCGDLEDAGVLLGGLWEENILVVPQGKLRMEIEALSTEIPGLGEAQVSVWSDGTCLFSLTAAWQEVDG